MSMTDTSMPLDFSQGSAQSLIDEGLRQLGLYSPELSHQAWQQWNNLPNTAERNQEFLLWLRGTPQYQTRFPYAAKLRAEGVPFTEAGALSYENQVRQLFHMVGVPDGFLTQDYLNNLIASNVSYNELEQRVAGGYQDYLNAPQVIKDEFTKQLGDPSAVLAFYLDPEHTVQQFNQIKANAYVKGFGNQFGLKFGDQAAQYAYGQSADQVQREVAGAAQLAPLQRGTLDQSTPLSDNDFAKAVFAGDQATVNKSLEQRAAEFSNAGGATTGQTTGFGVARGA